MASFGLLTSVSADELGFCLMTPVTCSVVSWLPLGQCHSESCEGLCVLEVHARGKPCSRPIKSSTKSSPLVLRTSVLFVYFQLSEVQLQGQVMSLSLKLQVHQTGLLTIVRTLSYTNNIRTYPCESMTKAMHVTVRVVVRVRVHVDGFVTKSL